MKKIIFLVSIVILFSSILLGNQLFAENMVTNQNFSELAQNPDNFVGVLAKLSGQIKNIETYENSLGYTIKVGDAEPLNTVFVLHDTKNTNFNFNSCVMVQGEIKGSVQFIDAFGEEFTVPFFWLEDFERLDCLEALHPTIAETNIPQTIVDFPAKITLEKMELSKDHARALISLENISPNTSFALVDYESFLIQEGKKFETKFVFIDYPGFEIFHSFEYGDVKKGWIIFEPVTPKPLEIHLELQETAPTFNSKTIVFKIHSFSDVSVPQITVPEPEIIETVDVIENKLVTLFAAGPNHSMYSYKWKQVSGESVELSSYATYSPTFMPPEVENGRIIVLQFQSIAIGPGGTFSGIVEIIVNPINHPPVVDAGEDKIFLPSINTITLVGSATDPDGDVLVFSWEQTEGPKIELKNNKSKTLTITSSSVDFSNLEPMKFKLTANDGFGGIASDSVFVIVNAPPKTSIPDWIKNNAKWWSEDQIDDQTFVNGIQFMIQNNIINTPNLPEQASAGTEQTIPNWIKTNAGWWADGTITEDDFLNGIEYLVKNGIIKLR